MISFRGSCNHMLTKVGTYSNLGSFEIRGLPSSDSSSNSKLGQLGKKYFTWLPNALCSKYHAFDCFKTYLPTRSIKNFCIDKYIKKLLESRGLVGYRRTKLF